MMPRQVGHTYRIIPEGKHGMVDAEILRQAELWKQILGGSGTFRGHRFGPDYARDGLYIDVMLPSMRWVVRAIDGGGVLYPRVNTWRSAYGLMRRLQGKTSR